MTVSPDISPLLPPELEPLGSIRPTEDHDADWASIVEGVRELLTAAAGTSWTDHNVADPGITLAEVAAFGLADLHYRISERTLAAWPMETPRWLPAVSRHWHATLPLGGVGAIAAKLAADQPTAATVLEAKVRACRTPPDAVALMAQSPWNTWTSAQRPHVIALMRARLVRTVAHEYADLVAGAVHDQDLADDDPVSVRDARAAQQLAQTLPLWPVEIAALVRRERDRLAREAFDSFAGEIRAATEASALAAVSAKLTAAGLGTDAVSTANSAGSIPPGRLPEDLEEIGGQTRVWPAHPLQALTCEPVTAADYARRARAHPEVGRAWVIAGRHAGIAWNGLPTDSIASVATDPVAAAMTLVVERVAKGDGDDAAFLRDALATAIGAEVTDPFDPWQDSLDTLDPRRTICDEVGACLLKKVEVIVQASLVTDIGADRTATEQGARDRLESFFTEGREPAPAEQSAADVSGPWPDHPQPPGGWTPGEAIRFSELVAALVGTPGVLGVERVAMKLSSQALFTIATAGSLAIPPDAVPVLADKDCLSVRYPLRGDCGA